MYGTVIQPWLFIVIITIIICIMKTRNIKCICMCEYAELNTDKSCWCLTHNPKVLYHYSYLSEKKYE